MATSSGGADPLDESTNKKKLEREKQQSMAPKYADLLRNKPYVRDNNKVPPKPVTMVHGEPTLIWKSSEVKALILQENLQYVVIFIFFYGRPEVNSLRKTIPGEYNKGNGFTTYFD